MTPTIRPRRKQATLGPQVWVVTAWNQKTNEDTVLVFRSKADADAAWDALNLRGVYGGVSRRTVR